MVSSPNRICPPSATCFSESSKATVNPSIERFTSENEQTPRGVRLAFVCGLLDFPAVLKVHTKVFNLLRGTFQSKNSCHVLGGEIGFQPVWVW